MRRAQFDDFTRTEPVYGFEQNWLSNHRFKGDQHG